MKGAVKQEYSGLKVALIHYWLVGMRGGEKVLEALCHLFPQADIFTHVVDPRRISPALKSHTIYETSIARLPFARRAYQSYLPLMPRALEALDVSGYDLVISSEAGPAKGVIVPPSVPHLCYCHSPMRYIWDQYPIYRAQAGPLRKSVMPFFAHRLRQWDVTSAARVDHFVANSHLVAARIKKYWRRDSAVLAPPVDINAFQPAPDIEDYYLWVGTLAAYKRPDLAIEAFGRLKKKLIVIGGPDKTARGLAKTAAPNVSFLGEADFETVKEHMAKCRALIFPGEEDFGIVPVEVMASGRPVIAFGKGGVLDSVVDGKTGLFFKEQSVSSLVAAVEAFEGSNLINGAQAACLDQAQRFSPSAFLDGMRKNLRILGV